MSKIEMKSHIDNKWRNVYWFARMLINGDKYGSIGTDNKLLIKISNSLKLIQTKKEISEENILKLQKKTFSNILNDRFKKATTRIKRINKLIEDIDKEINSLEDMEIFIFTCEFIMLPINQAIKNIPNDDKEFTTSISKAYLDLHKESGLSTIIKLWDDLGIKGCLLAERFEVKKAFTLLRILLTIDVRR